LGGGSILLSYEPNQGFFLTSDFQSTGEKLNFVGEYLADKNIYTYYLTTNEGEFQGGMLRSSVRVEVRVGSPSIFFADTYTHIEGEEVHVQSYRFMKS
ncbi:MAG: hypothetical protein GWO02_13965, partial [Gammaproteobacteria bacterium]|nr:hypothetical protein [Gammaproteobacteria bacterium]